MTTEFDQADVVRQVSERLAEKFPDKDAATIERLVQLEVAALAKKPVTDYVSVLSERAVRKMLKRS